MVGHRLHLLWPNAVTDPAAPRNRLELAEAENEIRWSVLQLRQPESIHLRKGLSLLNDTRQIQSIPPKPVLERSFTAKRMTLRAVNRQSLYGVEI